MLENITLVWRIFYLNGTGLVATCLAVCLLLPASWTYKSKWLRGIQIGWLVQAAYFMYFILAILYLFYPSYIDHGEPTIATQGSILANAWELYPRKETYSMHGLLYGPASAEIQFFSSAFGMPTILGSKLPVVCAFLVSGILLLRLIWNPFAKGYLLYLLPFSFFLFFVKADPLILLFSVLAISITRKGANHYYVTPVLVGVLAGLASALKMHGFLYILISYLVANIETGISLSILSAFFFSALIAFSACFIPENVSFLGFFEYIMLARKHGLSRYYFGQNIFYLFFILLPILFAATLNRQEINRYILIAGIMLAELLIAIVGAKPGAGFYHLMPLIPANAFLFQSLVAGQDENRYGFVKLGFVLMLIPVMMKGYSFAQGLLGGWHISSQVSYEVEQFGRKYPRLVMGITDNNGYERTFFRPILAHLGTRQIDYAAYMDLQYAHVGDEAISAALLTCKIENLLVPSTGHPFAMTNYYTDHPLFSDNTREAFYSRYSVVEKGTFFSVYSCSTQ